MPGFNPHSVQVPSGNVLNQGAVTYMEPYDAIAPEDVVVTPKLLKEVKTTETETFKLVAGSIDSEILSMNAVGTFNELPELGLTRLESAHEVAFGQLIVRSAFGDERAELASLKLFHTPQKAAHEFSVARYFMGAGKSHGFRTFEPLGITRVSTGEYGLLSKYEHGVISLDNVLWNPEHAIDGPVVKRAIGKAAYQMAALHSAGWTHGDAQIKNMFISNYAEPFVADLESTQPFKYKSGRPQEATIDSSVNDDIRTLAESVIARREEHDILPEDVVDMFCLIYIGIVNSPRSAVPMDLRKSMRHLKQFFDQ